MACLLFGSRVADIRRPVEHVTQKGVIVFAILGKHDAGSGFPAVRSTVVRTHEYGVLTGTKVFAVITAAGSVIAAMPGRATQTDLLGDGGRILPQGCSNASKGTLLQEFLFNIHSVREGKVFAVTLKTMTHMSILSDRQITLNMIHIQKRLCKRNFYP